MSEIRNKGGFSVSSKLKALDESQKSERESISKQKTDIQSRLESYRKKIEDIIFPELTKLEEESLQVSFSSFC